MFRVEMEMEDTIMIATEALSTSEEGRVNATSFDVLLIDRHSGKTHKTQMTFTELTAVFALGFGSVGEERTDGYWPERLYSQVKECLKDCPGECSPIP